jgi:hypothetical protein
MERWDNGTATDKRRNTVQLDRELFNHISGQLGHIKLTTFQVPNGQTSI